MLSLMVMYVRYLLLAIPVACVSGSYYMLSLMCLCEAPVASFTQGCYVRHLMLALPEVAM